MALPVGELLVLPVVEPVVLPVVELLVPPVVASAVPLPIETFVRTNSASAPPRSDEAVLPYVAVVLPVVEPVVLPVVEPVVLPVVEPVVLPVVEPVVLPLALEPPPTPARSARWTHPVKVTVCPSACALVLICPAGLV
ncbi:MAG TPA: hypothetical protein VK886_06605 [Vicinamibacterales bacterium]|nr:hypothetical protein [Vicinamibacterales bacterium]